MSSTLARWMVSSLTSRFQPTGELGNWVSNFSSKQAIWRENLAMSIPTKIEALFIRPFVKRVDEGGLIFYLVYEFERLRLLPGLDRSISNNCFEFKPNKQCTGGLRSGRTLRVQGRLSLARASFLLTHLRQTRDGRSHCRSQRYLSSKGVHAALESLASNLSRDPFNRPAGTGLFSS